ncbi:metallophosphoesterase family protein, partial [Klebsiella pneumoniae]|uniref:metallophosphoesterase family protein n=1 Tax=Klebsiella pneumoniae TaxID=573 RepID=UPI003B987C27
FAVDNAQNARPEEFALFLELAGRLGVPWHPMVGDHDAADGPEARNFRGAVGPTYASFALAGQRFIRLNTNEARPVGLGEAQLDWLEGEL